MKIGIMSDSHGALDEFSQVMDQFKDADKIIHLGDVLYHGPRNPLPESYNPAKVAEIIREDDRFIFVRGNCDAEVDSTITGKEIVETESLIDIGDHIFYLHHGHRYSEAEMVARAKEAGANIVLYGHTHIKTMKTIDGVTVVNPGSICLPKDGSKSYALYDQGLLMLCKLDGTLCELEEN